MEGRQGRRQGPGRTDLAAIWRDFPEMIGDWNSAFRRFSWWSAKGVWWRIFHAQCRMIPTRISDHQFCRSSRPLARIPSCPPSPSPLMLPLVVINESW